MKTLALGVLAIAVTALVAVQHQQLGQLHAENATLQTSAAEADQLKADLAKSTGAEANAEGEIARLREENHDLLKLRNQVYQLRQATAQFQQVSAENQRLQAPHQNASTRHSDPKEVVFQPIVILVQNLYDEGLNTPESATETFFWAERAGPEALRNCVVPERWPQIADGSLLAGLWQNFDNLVSIEIAARRDIDANTVQLGIQYHLKPNSESGRKLVLTCRLRNGEWKLDM